MPDGGHQTAQRPIWEAIIKVAIADPPERRARDIAEGIGYACALLRDEYGWSADDIERLLERLTDDARDGEARFG